MSEEEIKWRLYRCEFEPNVPIVLVEYLKCCQSLEQAQTTIPNLTWQQQAEGKFVTEPEPMIPTLKKLEYYSIEQR